MKLFTTFEATFDMANSKDPSVVNAICISSLRCTRDYLCKILVKANVATDEGNCLNETLTLNKEIKLE